MTDSVEKSPELRLVVIEGPDSGTEAHVPESTERLVSVSLGRSQGSAHDLQLTDRGVSRRHATLTVAGGVCKLCDGDGSTPSTNGTMVNDRAVAFDDPRELRSGDEIRLGPFTVVRFEIRAAEPDVVAPPVVAAAVEESPPARVEPVAAALPPLILPGERIARASAPREQFGPYDVYGTIDQGRYDRVDAAMDRDSHVPVALKRFVDISQRSEVRERILEEAARSRRWHHTIILRALDSGVREEVPYLVGRLVDGVTLTTARERSRVDPALAAYALGRVCDAFTYAQSVEPGFVHGWLTPRRIMLNRRGEIVLLNFGNPPIATLVTGSAKDAGAGDQYRAPEVQSGSRPQARSDVFSLGIILYELLAGKTVEAADTGNLPDLHFVAPRTPERLVSIVSRATARGPGDRFENATEMGEQVALALRGLAPTYGPYMAAQAVSRIAATGASSEA